MRTTTLAALLLAGTVTTAATAQTLSQRAETARQEKEAKERAAKAGPNAAACASANPNEEEACLKAANEAAKKNNAGQKGIIAALNAGNAKMQAQDFDGAIVDYQAGVSTAPAGHANLYELHNALANAYRVRATRNFNAAIGPGVTQLPPAVLTSVGGDLKASLEQSSLAAAIAGTDQAKLDKVGASMRETAKLWAGADRAGVVAAARPTLDIEKTLFDKWAATATPQQLSQYAPGMAFALLPKDKAAGVALATTMYDKQPNDMDTLIAYAQVVAEAKLPATDPARARAKAAVENALTNGTTNDSQKVKLRNARIKLNATS